MSYNNYVDADAAWRAAYDFAEPCVAIIKHANPCGIAVGDDIAEAHRKAHACDPVQRLRRRDRREPAGDVGDGRAGGRDLHRGDRRAGATTTDALEVLPSKKNLRLLVAAAAAPGAGVESRPISGGLLMQTRRPDRRPGDDPATWTLAAGDAGRRRDARPISPSPGGRSGR